MNLRRYLPRPAVRAGISWSLALALIAFMFLYAADGAYWMAGGHAFFALLNLDAGRAQWRKRDTEDVIA